MLIGLELVVLSAMAIPVLIIVKKREKVNTKEAIEARYQEYRRVNEAMVPAEIDELLES